MDRFFRTAVVTLWSLFSVFGSSFQEGVQCGRPGRPVNGTISPAGKSYFPGEKVTYSCLEGFVLFGEEGRTCLKNGTWSGQVPLCDFNLARGKRSLQSATLWSYSPDLAVDGNSDTCSFTPRGPEPRWWQVHLGHKFNVVAIGVTISPGSFQEFTIFVIELLADNKALYKPCTTFKGVFQTQKGLFKCNDGLGHPGQFVYLRDDREEEEYFGLCEVEVFAFREKIPCGEPEVPVQGRVSREGEEKASYSCNVGFKLEGDESLTCSSKGKWQGQPPRCHEMSCPPAPQISNGFIDLSPSRGESVYGTKAHYSCSNGYFLEGPSVLVCGDKGLWSNEPPVCQIVTCGPPPSFPHSKFILLNDTNQWNKIAVYTCFEGYKLLVESEDTVTTCLGNGTWRAINVTCVPTEMTKFFNQREGQGRSLSYEIHPNAAPVQPMPNLVITLAIIAGILAIVMLVVGILFVRKRFLTGPGSLSPLVRTPEKQSPDVYVIGGFHHQRPNNGPIPGYIDGLGRPTHFQSNLLQSIAQKDYRSHINGSDKCSEDGASLGLNDPPYEKVKSRSEHSYETLKKKSSIRAQKEGQSDNADNYESVANDKESIGYEPIMSVKEPCYEIASYKDTGYELVKDKNHDYETVKDKEAGYETVKEDQDPGYEVVQEEKKSIHGYETLKPKLPPRDQSAEEVPDILQNLHSNDEDVTGEVPLNNQQITADVPPEILALYARVDKSKKSKKEPIKSPAPVRPNHLSLKVSKSDGLSQGLQRKISKLPNGARELIRKFNSMTPEEAMHQSVSPQSSITSEGSLSSGAGRPLPPLPR